MNYSNVMKQLVGKTNYFHRSTSNYFLVRDYLEGPLIRSVYLTIYDIEGKSSSWATMFISQKHVIICTTSRTPNLNEGLHELEASDIFSVIPGNSSQLKTILNATGDEQSFKYFTTNPISFIHLNKNFLLLTDIQSDQEAGKSVFNIATGYIIEKNYSEKQKNLVTLIESVLLGKPVVENNELPGLKNSIILINIWGSVIAYFVVISVFIFVASLVFFRIGR